MLMLMARCNIKITLLLTFGMTKMPSDLGWLLLEQIQRLIPLCQLPKHLQIAELQNAAFSMASDHRTSGLRMNTHAASNHVSKFVVPCSACPSVARAPA